MSRHSSFPLLCALLTSLAIGCTTPPAKDAPQTATSTTPSATPTETPTAVVTATDAGTVPSATPEAGPAPLVVSTDGWMPLATAKKTISLRYPADVFPKTKLVGESLALESTLTRKLLGEDPGNKVHRFQIQIDVVAGTPFEAVKKYFKTYPFPQMFPKGDEASFVDGEGARAVVGGHQGYRVHTGVEGYNEDTSLLEVDPKKTLRFRCTYVGSVMGPEIDEEKQVAICDAVLGTVFAAKAP